MIKTLAVIFLLAVSVSGCVPLMVGGFIGYKISENEQHNAWCAAHVGDPSCHP